MNLAQVYPAEFLECFQGSHTLLIASEFFIHGFSFIRLKLDDGLYHKNEVDVRLRSPCRVFIQFKEQDKQK